MNQESALLHARKAVQLEDTDAQPHVTLAWICHMRREYDQARRHLNRALTLNPNDADGLANCAMILIAEGEPERGIECAETAIRLNPSHPDWYLAFLFAGYLFSRNFDEAIRLRGMIPADAMPEGRALLAAAYAHAGDIGRASEFIGEFLQQFSRHWKEAPSARLIADLFAFKRQEDAALFIEGMCKAGMPE